MSILVFSVGDENHEPHPEQMQQVVELGEENLGHKYDEIIALPYYVDLQEFDTEEIEERIGITGEELKDLEEFIRQVGEDE